MECLLRVQMFSITSNSSKCNLFVGAKKYPLCKCEWNIIKKKEKAYSAELMT